MTPDQELPRQEILLGKQFIGEIYHNMGCAYARLFQMEEAIRCFEIAYGKLHTMGAVKSLLYAVYMEHGVDAFVEKAKELGCGAICMEGNIDFYGKSGYRQASEFGIRYHGLTEDDDASFFLCRELIPGYLDGITGEYAPPQGYYVDEQEAEVFDKTFYYKEKKKLPGQLF